MLRGVCGSGAGGLTKVSDQDPFHNSFRTPLSQQACISPAKSTAGDLACSSSQETALSQVQPLGLRLVLNCVTAVHQFLSAVRGVVLPSAWFTWLQEYPAILKRMVYGSTTPKEREPRLSCSICILAEVKPPLFELDFDEFSKAA